ncbi:hypothetical protein [Arthrobacter sp. KBS0703]|uniref:hypothetical protein n=1 Tax=Arthrobacter sp. KBS0703 TaxID=1955698 RepID=UPI00163D9FD1|nr:hypothetical protein [Arthrobacter sp. KBS0703]
MAAAAGPARGRAAERRGPGAVSYTHLDVYKRQPACPCPGAAWALSASCLLYTSRCV